MEIKKEYEYLLLQLSDPELISDWEKFNSFSKRKNFLEEILEKEKELKEIKNKIEGNKEILKAGEDPELGSLAKEEIVQLQEKEKVLEDEIKESLEKKESSNSEKNGGKEAAIIEIRAGTGGEEAALFVGDLFRMYSRYGESQGWRQKTLDSHPTELGGFKEIIFEMKNGNVFSKIKYEAGVHRVQRIPKTEKQGRIHTSTISVAVLPKPKKTEIQIKPEELKVGFHRSSGPGGQYVNKRETAVRIVHLPTGIVVTSQVERNQLKNRENALAILAARILKMRETKAIDSISGKRNAQIGKAKRAEKIRTYNFPQDRITDHRLKKSWRNLERILAGELDSIINALQKNISDSEM